MPYVYAVTNPTNLFDNNYVTNRTNYLQSSCYARWVFTTTATQCWLRAYTNAGETYDNISVYVNGAEYLLLEFTVTNSDEVFQFDLPAGAKTVELVSSIQSLPAATVLSTWLKLVYFSGGATCTQQTPTAPQIVVYGDSTVGDGATNLIADAWVNLLRYTYGYRVAVEAWGYRSLFADAPDAAGRTALSAQLAGYAPTIGVWLAIGTNDYGLETQSAADFGAAYSDLLDKLHADLPTSTIYCQTPIVRTSEVANTFGDTLGAYRTAIGTAVGARDYCVLVDGSAFITTALLADTLHPSTAGHAAIAADVAGVLG